MVYVLVLIEDVFMNIVEHIIHFISFHILFKKLTNNFVILPHVIHYIHTLNDEHKFLLRFKKIQSHIRSFQMLEKTS